jgi:sugar/nucleoside kinase (ribokinase family)
MNRAREMPSTAALLPGLLEQWSLESTLRFASAMGASCTRALGCTEGVFHLHEAEAFVAQNPLDIRSIRL